MTSDELAKLVAGALVALKEMGAGSVPVPIPQDGPTVGTVIQEYLKSGDFRALAAASKPPYERVLTRWARIRNRGVQAIAAITRPDIEGDLSKESIGAAGFLCKRLKVLFKYALARCYITADPCHGIKTPNKGGSWHTWTDDEIATFRAFHAPGTRPRLAFELVLNCALRRTDGALLTWEQVKDRAIRLRQSKTGAVLVIPVGPELQAAIDAWKGPRTGAVIRHPRRRKGLTAESFGNLMADWIHDAGLPERCVLHGLRKGRCRQLAEAGCSEKELSAVSGHVTLAMVAHYTKAADQERLARAAMGRLNRPESL
jgi:integrase